MTEPYVENVRGKDTRISYEHALILAGKVNTGMAKTYSGLKFDKSYPPIQSERKNLFNSVLINNLNYCFRNYTPPDGRKGRSTNTLPSLVNKTAETGKKKAARSSTGIERVLAKVKEDPYATVVFSLVSKANGGVSFRVLNSGGKNLIPVPYIDKYVEGLPAGVIKAKDTSLYSRLADGLYEDGYLSEKDRNSLLKDFNLIM